MSGPRATAPLTGRWPISHGAANPAAGTTDPGLQAADETPQCDRRHPERVSPGARLATGSVSRLGQSEATKLFHWSSLQCEAVDSARGVETAAGRIAPCRPAWERGGVLKSKRGRAGFKMTPRSLP